MKAPQGISGTAYVRVNKSLYGLKQSGRAWYEKLHQKLISLDFNKSESDHCVYIYQKKQVVIGVYVDDLVICGKIIEHIIKIKNQL